MTTFSNSHNLLVAAECVLIVIDVQKPFAEKMGSDISDPILKRIDWLVGATAWFGIPVIVTAEDMPRLGSIPDGLSRQLAAGTTVHNKMIFDLTATPVIVDALNATGKRTVILTGFMTDVCVAQSAVGLLGLGYRVVTLSDCVGSHAGYHESGLNRMSQAGVVVLTMRAAIYEWLRTVEAAQSFRSDYLSTHKAPAGVPF